MGIRLLRLLLRLLRVGEVTLVLGMGLLRWWLGLWFCCNLVGEDDWEPMILIGGNEWLKMAKSRCSSSIIISR
jgi:hypothetical protein